MRKKARRINIDLRQMNTTVEQQHYIASRKIQAAGLEIELIKGLAYEMDFPDRSFEGVLSSLLFHHLTSEHKREAIAEIYRALKPGGELHVADWGKSQNILVRSAFLMVQLLDAL